MNATHDVDGIHITPGGSGRRRGGAERHLFQAHSSLYIRLYKVTASAFPRLKRVSRFNHRLWKPPPLLKIPLIFLVYLQQHLPNSIHFELPKPWCRWQIWWKMTPGRTTKPGWWLPFGECKVFPMLQVIIPHFGCCLPLSRRFGYLCLLFFFFFWF